MNNKTLTHKELRTIIGLSIIFTLRMSGIFMILPVLTIYAMSLHDANAHLIGIALGIYGITQIIFQLPLGIMADKIGYKPVIIIGLIIFVIGCEIAAITNNIWGLIIGRALQGASAIGSTFIALVLRILKNQEKIQKAMAIIGINFGITFSISIICGPIITNLSGLHGLFHGSALLSIIAVLLSIFIIPTMNCNQTKDKIKNCNAILCNIKKILINIQLIKLNFSVFFLHTILILNFIALPQIITNLGYMPNMHWKIYSIIIIISGIFILPCIFISKKKYSIKKTLIVYTNLLFLSELTMLVSIHYCWVFFLGMQLFFITFSLIETILPAIINQQFFKNYTSTTISIYSISQFLGIGFGGILGGFLLEIKDTWLVLFFALIISLISIKIVNKLNNNI